MGDLQWRHDGEDDLRIELRNCTRLMLALSTRAAHRARPAAPCVPAQTSSRSLQIHGRIHRLTLPSWQCAVWILRGLTSRRCRYDRASLATGAVIVTTWSSYPTGLRANCSGLGRSSDGCMAASAATPAPWRCRCDILTIPLSYLDTCGRKNASLRSRRPWSANIEPRHRETARLRPQQSSRQRRTALPVSAAPNRTLEISLGRGWDRGVLSRVVFVRVFSTDKFLRFLERAAISNRRRPRRGENGFILDRELEL
jgi:hypothetical protein